MSKLLLVGLLLIGLSGCTDIPSVAEQTKPCLAKGGIPLFSVWGKNVMVDCKFKGE